MKKDKKSELQPLSSKFDIIPIRVGLEQPERISSLGQNESEKDRKERVSKACKTVSEYIQKYRLALRESAFVLSFSQIPTETWNDEKGRASVGGSKKTSEVLSSFTGKEVTCARQLDRFIKAQLPEIYSSTMQMAGDAVWDTCSALDPELKIERYKLILSGSRKVAKFFNEPLHIKWFNKFRSDVIIDEHYIFIKWDRSIGWVQFKILGKKLKSGKRGIDPSRWHVIRQLMQGNFVPAGSKIQLMKNGKFRFIFSYYGPSCKKNISEREAELSFMPNREEFMHLNISKGHRPGMGLPTDELVGYTWSAVACLDKLDQLQKMQDRALDRVKSCGAFVKAKKSEQRKRDRITLARTNVISNWAHHWSVEVANRIESMGCGSVEVVDIPSEKLFERPFNWAKFRFDLEYKCRLRGIKVIYRAPEKETKEEAEVELVETEQ